MRRGSFLFLTAVLFCIQVSAQNLSGILNLNPYPSPYASDWETNPGSLGALTVYNNSGSSQEIRVRAIVSMQGRGEVFRGLSNTILLTSSPVQLLDNTKIISLSDASFADNDYKNKLQLTGRLLEGNYTACLTMETATGAVLSSNICANFTILYPSAPQLLFPVNNDSIDAANNYPVFQWTPVIVPPAYQITYALRISEVLPGQTPLQAITANVPLYENNQLLLNSLIYPIEALPFEGGKKYAWQVQALDQYGFPPSQNQGRSEIFTFVKKKFLFPTFIFSQIFLTQPTNNSVLTTKKPEFKWLYNPGQGENVKYHLKVSPVNPGQSNEQAINNPAVFNQTISSGSGMFTPQANINFLNNTDYVWQVNVINAATNAIIKKSVIWKFRYKLQQNVYTGGGGLPVWSSLSGTLHYKFSGPGESGSWPLANKSIKLVLKYVMKIKSHSGNMYYSGGESPKGTILLGLPDAQLFGNDSDLLLDVKTTDNNGNFKFTFINADSMGLVKKDHVINRINEHGFVYTGDIYRVARILVDDKYYLSPDDDQIVQPWENKQAGTVYSAIRSYTLNLRIKASPEQIYTGQFATGGIHQMDVYILRKNRPFNVPSNEGNPKPVPPETLFGYEVVGKKETDQNGYCTISRLIVNHNPTDSYYLYARSTKNAPHNYIVFLGKFRFHYDQGISSIDKYEQVTNQSDKVVHVDPYTHSGGIVVYPSDNTVFNAQYTHRQVSRNFYAMPLLPEITGRVVRSDNTGIGLSDATVNLMKLKSHTVIPGYTISIPVVEKTAVKPLSDGRFSFHALPVNFNSSMEAIGPKRSLLISSTGYKTLSFDIQGSGMNGALRMGQRIITPNIGLDPGAIVQGYISDEDGAGIFAKIRIGDSPDKTVNPVFGFKNGQPFLFPGKFIFPVAMTNNQPLVVTPVYSPASYIIDTTYINVNTPFKNLDTIKVYRKTHKINVTVVEHTPSNPNYLQWPRINAARVKVEVLGGHIEKYTNSSGRAEFRFENDATEFKVIVEGPDNLHYVKRTGIIFNSPSKFPQEYFFSLEKGTFISGQVFVADVKPVSDADVWIDFGNPDMNIFAKTNANGQYILKNVPRGKFVRVFASKTATDTTIVGDSVHVFTGNLGLGKTGVNLYLKIYYGMDITRLHGFPVLLTDLKEESGGKVKISGVIKQFLKNTYFNVFDSISAKLNFTGITVEPGSVNNPNGVPYAVVSQPDFLFDNPVLDLKLFNTFKAVLGEDNGIHLNKISQDKGSLKGKTSVPASSFNTNGSLSGYSKLYLSMPGSSPESMLIPSLTSDGKPQVNLPSGFHVVNKDGNGLQFKINTFDADAVPSESFFNFDTVRLRTILHTEISNAVPSDLKLNIGDVVFHQNGIDPVNGDKPFSFKLDNWNLFADKWYFNKGYLTITDGLLKTGADIKIKSLSLSKTKFLFPEFDFTNLMVSGVAPLTISGSITFDYNSYQKYWYVALSKKQGTDHSAYFKGLPGMEPAALMKIDNFSVNSKESFFLLSPLYGQVVKLYKVGNLKLGPAGALLAYNDYLYIPGLSFNIPNVSQSTAVEYFKNTSGNIAFRMKGININTTSGSGVYMKFGINESQQNTQKLDESGFRSRGVTGEDGKFELNTWLFHTADSTTVVVETPSTPFSMINQFQTLKIGNQKTYLSKVTGGMNVSGGKWNYFGFAGDLNGTKGVTDQNKRLGFTVYGEIKADNQKISLSNVNTPFGGMSWTYEFENSRLIGNMDIKQDMGGIKIDGTAEMLIDGSGWYFIGGGTMQVPGVGPGYAAALFGDYPVMTQSVKQKFAQASYKKDLPNSFQKNISGFLLSGAMSVPVIVPNIGFNLKIVSVELGIDAGGDIKIYKGFDEGGSTYGLSALGFIQAFLKMEAITCTKLSAKAVVELGFEGSYQSGSGTFNLDGCGGFLLHAHLTQKLWGCDLDGCGCMGTIFDEGFTFTLKALMHLDSNGNKSFNFDTGTCSGN